MLQGCGQSVDLGCTEVSYAAPPEDQAKLPPVEQKDQHNISRAELPDVPRASAWRGECDFSRWLEHTLASERAAVAGRLQEMVSDQLSDHRKALLGDLELRVSSVFAAAAQTSDGRTPMPSEARDPRGMARFGKVEAKDRSENGDVPALPLPLANNMMCSHSHGSRSVTISEIAVEGRGRGSTESTTDCCCAPLAKCSDQPMARTPSAMKDKESEEPFRKTHSRKSGRLMKIRAHLSEGFGMSSSEANTLVGCVTRLVRSPGFELLFSMFIVANTIVMAVEVQLSGCKLGVTLQHPDCDGGEGVWTEASVAFKIVSVFFAVMFVIEFVLRLICLRIQAIKDPWMWFDFVIITLGSIDAIERLGGSLNLSVNPAMMRTARIARALRLAKVLKARDGFASLFLLMKSLQASSQAFAWFIMILLFTMSCVGMLMNQLIYGYLADEGLSVEDRREVFDYFGTYTRMLITMFELTLGNWAPPSRILMSKVSEWWGLFIVVYRCMFCFGLVNVCAAVFITETHRAAASDDEVMMMRKQRNARDVVNKLHDVFEELDESGDGLVTWEEFQQLMHDQVIRHFLANLDLEIGDLEELFKLLDNGDGQVDCEEFVEGLQTIRGTAKNIDLLTVLKLTRRMDASLCRVEEHLNPTVSRAPARLRTSSYSRMKTQAIS